MMTIQCDDDDEGGGEGAEGGDIGFHRAMTLMKIARRGAQDEDGGKKEMVGGRGAVALASADDDGKKRGEVSMTQGRAGEGGGRAGGLLYQALCRGLQGRFGGEKWIFAPEMP